jgi:chaperonin GroEL
MIYQKSKAKDILSDKDKLNKIVSETIDVMAQAVGATLGPGGRPVLIERDGLSPLATKDGVTVAKSLGLANSEANIIVDAAKEICINTAKQAGDGTTTAIVLANELVKRGQKFLESNPKYNPQKMINELNYAYSKVIVPFLQNASIPIDEEEQLKQVATISANGDIETAEIVVEAVMAAGDDGTVLINEGRDAITKVETVDGYIVTTGLKDIGQIGPAFINDKAGQQVKMDEGLVVLYDGAMNDLKVPGAIQTAVANDQGYTDGTPIIVLAHSFADSVLDKFAKTTKSGLTVVPVKTPRSGLPNGASEFLNDMAAYTGALIYDPGNVDNMNKEGLGKFKEATVNMYESFIMCDSNPGEIEARIGELRSIEKAAFSEMDKSFVRAAIAKLTGGVATIIVGGNSDLEIREKKGRVEDAVEAARSAIAEGIVPGGASMHLRLAKELSKHGSKKDSWDILIEALRAPFNLLMTNCGEEPDQVYGAIQQFVENETTVRPLRVFDANEHTTVDPLEAGIIEPAKVVRVSIGNALSVASLLTTLGGIVVVPRDSNLEMQMELANQAFGNMMNTVGDQ